MSKVDSDGDVRRVHTYCRVCEPACALIAEVRDGSTANDTQVVRLLPDKNHPVHKGFACHKGLGFDQIHHDPDRLNAPLKRGTSGLEVVSWEDAVTGIAEKLTAIGTAHSDGIGMYIGNPSAFNSTGRMAARQFARGLGVRYAFGSGTQDCSNKFAASEAMYGTANLHPIPDYEHTRFLLSIGSNPRVSHASFVHMTDPMAALRGIVSRGARVVHVNPRNIESVTPATGELLQIRPDTDVYLLAAILHEIKRHGWQKQDWLDEHASNEASLWAFVADYPSERVAPIVGVTTEEIRDIAHAFAHAAGASVHMSTGANMGRQGTLCYWLTNMLSLVTGNLGRQGGNLYSPGYFPAATVGKPRTEDPFFDSPFGELRLILGNLPGNLLADYIEAGHVKALICMSGNPMLSMAGEQRLAEALQKLDLLVVVDIYPNATAQHADYVLPATDWLERADVNAVSLGFQPEPYVQYTDAVVPPKYERKPEWWIFASISRALGHASMLDQETPDPLARLDRQLAHSNLSLAQLRAKPDHTIVLPKAPPGALFATGVQLADHRVDACPSLFARSFATVRDQFDALAAESADTLKLISLRTNYMVNSWFHNVPSLKRDHALDNPLHMNPQDAQRLQLRDGSEVVVATDKGEVIATLCVDNSLRTGVVAMTHGWGHAGNTRLNVASNHPGTNVNALLPTGPGSFDPLSNMSHMTGIPVQVSAA